MTGDDMAIVLAVRNGDREAFGGLVDRHKDRVYAVLRNLLADPALAEELAHEAFVRAYRSLHTFRGEARFGTWLVQIAINLARDHVRTKQRAKVVPIQGLKPEDEGFLVERRVSYDPLLRLQQNELAEMIQGAIEELPEDYREVFVLKHLEELPYEQIAQLTGDSVGALKVRAHRARKLVMEAVASQESGRTR